MPWQQQGSGFTTKRGGHIANPEQYEKLRSKGMSKGRAAAITNSVNKSDGGAMVDRPITQSQFSKALSEQQKRSMVAGGLGGLAGPVGGAITTGAVNRSGKAAAWGALGGVGGPVGGVAGGYMGAKHYRPKKKKAK